MPAPGAVPVPAFGFIAPAAPVPAPLGTAVPSAEELPIGMFVAGMADVLVGGDRVAFGLDESVPFCELAALAAWTDEAASSAKAVAPAMIVMRFMVSPPPLGIVACIVSFSRRAQANPRVATEFRWSGFAPLLGSVMT